MRDCVNAELRDLLPDYARGRLSGAGRAAVERHVASCADCAAELEILRAAGRALGVAPAVDVARIVAALPPAPARRSEPGVTSIESRRRPAAAHVPVRPWARRVAAIAAVVVGVVGITLARPGEHELPPVSLPTAGSPRDGAVEVASADRDVPVLTMAGGVGDLSEEELRTLLGELETIDDGTAFEVGDVTLPAVSGIEEDTT